MSLSKEALQHIEENARTGTEVADGSAMLVSQGFDLRSLEEFQPTRRRFRGVFTTEGLSDFTAYIESRADEGIPVFIDREHMQARCYLDVGSQDEPGHCEHAANLQLPKSPEFQAFMRANGNTFDQDSIVELLEDWGHLMIFQNSAGEFLDRSKVIHAFRKVSIDDLTSIDSEKQEHSSQVGVMNKVTVKQAERLPTVIAWAFEPYEGLGAREFTMRVSTITKGGPAFRLRAMALDMIEKEVAREFADKIEAQLDGCECLIGSFKP